MIGLLRKLWRSFENPATPLSDPDNWAIEAFGGGTTGSGVLVNSESALSYPPVFRGVSLISGDVGKLPFFVYRRLAGGGKERATSHPAFRILRHKANDFQTATEFKNLLQANALLWGNGYALIERTKPGAPSGLIPLNPARVKPFKRNGRVWYEVIVDEGPPVDFPWTDVFHIKGLASAHSGGLAGVSVIQKAKEALGLGLAAMHYGARFFANDASPRTVLEHPGRMEAAGKVRLREAWERMHRGTGNAHRTAILEEGMKLKPFSVHPEDAQLIETREHEIRATVSNILGIPPHMLGDPSRTSFSSLAEENQSYLDRSLDPWLARWESEAWDKLLTDRQQRADSHVVEYLRAALVRANLGDRFAAYAVALANGIMNLDEVRDLENLNPLPKGLGKDFTRPLNLGVIGEETEPPPTGPESSSDPDGPPGSPPEEAGTAPPDDEARADLLRAAVLRIVKRLAMAAKRSPDLERWLATPLGGRQREVAEDILRPVLAVCLPGGPDPASAASWIRKALRGSPESWADTIPDAFVREWSEVI